MNDLGRNLLNDLRSGVISDRAFNMRNWISDCGTVGCIAGHTLMRDGKTATLQYGRIIIIDAAATALELPEPIAKHLFIPQLWTDALHHDSFVDHYESIWTDNWRCDLDTIARMKEWAESLPTSIYPRIGRLQAANALEQALKGEPYIDWRRAIA